MGKSYIQVSAFVSAGTTIRKGQPVALCARRTESAEENEEGLEDHLVAMVKEELDQLHEKGHMGEAFRENIEGRVEEQLVALIGDEGLKDYEGAPGERQKRAGMTRDNTFDGEWEEKQENRRCGECTRRKEEEK